MTKLVSLGEIAEIGAGNSAPQNKALFDGGSLPFIRTSDVGAIHIGRIESSRDLLTPEGTKGLKLFPAGTILFPKSGASTFLNHRVILSESAYVSSHLATIKAINEVALDHFIFYFLQTVDARDLCQDQAYPSLNRDQIAGIQLALPSLKRQQEIVEKLDSAFTEIDLLEEKLVISDEKANQLLRSILSSVFTFENASGSESNSSTNKGSFINKNYNFVRLGTICDSISGLWTGKKPPFEKATVIRNTNFTKDCKLDLSDVAVLDVESKQLQGRTLIPGDLIVEKSGGGPKQAVGRVVHFNESVGTYSMSNFTAALRIRNSGQALSKYLQHFLYFQYISGVTETMQSNSTGIRNLNIQQFLDIEVPLPSLEVQQAIVEKLDTIFAEVELMRAQLKTQKDYAGAIRQSFLSSAYAQELEIV